MLDLADANGVVKHSPKRKLRYSHSDDARVHADRLVGSLVTTETHDPIQWPASHWWVSLAAYDQPQVAISRQTTKVFGPPGTGKTTTLINYVKEHVKLGVPTNKIAFLSFTNAAADVARQRVLEAFPEKTVMDFPNFSTLHSLATRIGGLMNKNILDIEKLQQFDPNVRNETVWMKKGDPSSAEDRPDYMPLAVQSFARARCISIDEAIEQGNFESFNTVASNQMLLDFLSKRRGHQVAGTGLPLLKAYMLEYNTFKQRNNLADFDDVIDNAQQASFLPQIPSFDLLIIDEAQDLSDLQWRLVQRLMGKAKRVIVAGDDDQAIMVPFGASPLAFLDLPGDTEILPQSRRVPKAVHDYVEMHTLPLLVRAFPNRMAKTWLPVDFEGQIHTKVEKQKKETDPSGQTQVVTVKSSIKLKDLLSIVKTSASEQWLIVAPTKSTCRSISAGLTQLKVPHYHRNQPILNPEQTASDVRVMSIHTSKGDEADNVALVVLSIRDHEMLENDPRLRYVAQTRSKKALYPEVSGD